MYPPLAGCWSEKPGLGIGGKAVSNQLAKSSFDSCQVDNCYYSINKPGIIIMTYVQPLSLVLYLVSKNLSGPPAGVTTSRSLQNRKTWTWDEIQKKTAPFTIMPRNQSVICLTWANSVGAPPLIAFCLGLAPWPDLRLPAIWQPSNPRIHPEQSSSSKTDYYIIQVHCDIWAASKVPSCHCDDNKHSRKICDVTCFFSQVGQWNWASSNHPRSGSLHLARIERIQHCTKTWLTQHPSSEVGAWPAGTFVLNRKMPKCYQDGSGFHHTQVNIYCNLQNRKWLAVCVKTIIAKKMPKIPQKDQDGAS